VEGEEPYVFWGHYVKGQGHRYRKYNFWQQGRFHMITLVLCPPAAHHTQSYNTGV
jgi:hypothetical protein